METMLKCFVCLSSDIFLYADDSKIYKVIRNQSDQQKLQSVLNLIKKWSDEWLLRLNIDKCKSVSYCINILQILVTVLWTEISYFLWRK